jgi:hypothetical protein
MRRIYLVRMSIAPLVRSSEDLTKVRRHVLYSSTTLFGQWNKRTLGSQIFEVVAREIGPNEFFNFALERHLSTALHKQT